MTIRRLIRLLAILDGKTHKGGCAVLVAGVAAGAAGAAAVGVVIL